MSEHAMYGYAGHRNSNRGSKKNLESTPGKPSIDSLKQTAVLGTSYIMWRVLQSETCWAVGISGGSTGEEPAEGSL